MSDESPIVFTESCCAKVADLIAEENNPDLKLRVFVNGGGCSGFQYGFTFDEIKNDDDFEIEKAGLKFLVDPMSYQYLIGAEIDYTESLQGSQLLSATPMPKPRADAVPPSRFNAKTSRKSLRKPLNIFSGFSSLNFLT